MLQDAGLSLDDIAGVLDAADVAEWKAIAAGGSGSSTPRSHGCNERGPYLEGALLCRYDHPATECRIMGDEIDRRLATSGSDPTRAQAIVLPDAVERRARSRS